MNINEACVGGRNKLGLQSCASNDVYCVRHATLQPLHPVSLTPDITFICMHSQSYPSLVLNIFTTKFSILSQS